MVLTGFNTDFKFKGQTYHAQTEDNGVDNPVVVTLLYLKGAILSSKKTSYSDLLGEEAFQGKLMEIMKSQHRNMMKSVLTGQFEEGPKKEAVEPVTAEAGPPPPAEKAVSPPAAEATSPAAAPPQEVSASNEPKGLDEAILGFLASFESGPSPGA
jgi:hypothetical protein